MTKKNLGITFKKKSLGINLRKRVYLGTNLWVKSFFNRLNGLTNGGTNLEKKKLGITCDQKTIYVSK